MVDAFKQSPHLHSLYCGS